MAFEKNIHSVSVEIGGRELTFETGWVAKQASGAVIVKQNDSQVLVTAVGGTSDRPFDFLPLTVDFVSRTAARGKIPGGFLKREGRPDERGTLICRLIDRPIRPQFPKHWRSELQIIATVLSYDDASDIDVLSMCGASAAAHISDLPLQQPVAAVRVVRHEGEFKINPSNEEIHASDINLVVAGTADAIAMVEGGAMEADEASMIDAMDLAHENIKKIIGAIDELQKLAGKEKRPVPPAPVADEAIAAKVAELDNGSLLEAMSISNKHARSAGLKEARNAIIAQLVDGVSDDAEVERITGQAKKAWSKLVSSTMRKRVTDKGIRIDGRATDEVRDLDVQVGVAPRTHGSALFTRGETQAFVSATLGIEMDAQRIDWAGAKDQFRRWMLQYSFPPFSTGEARRMMGPKRREVGHGALAHRALEAVIPDYAEFPYVLRCVSDVTESNGSSSMASVCGASLSLMDAGVPLKRAVAGIAMGLVREDGKYAVLSDILGDEDHLGDMDFKVTGTTQGITAFQMDTKISGVPREVMLRAMNQAREGRLLILEAMNAVIPEGREELSAYAPRISTIKINQDKIRDIIGPGGKMIRSIQDRTGTRLTVEDDGTVKVSSSDQAAADKAIDIIRELTQEAEIGKLYLGVVKRTVDFGAFVEIFPGTEGLVHISHLAEGRVNRTTDVVVEGDELLVRVIDIDRSGKIRLSRKEALAASDEFGSEA
ncbi:MAG: polyribonucleotide nucleotidyltransferase [Myxococcota bacterium]|nr:polyribonucleotide nucleotidyltransferase [Myxococcota bacterium]